MDTCWPPDPTITRGVGGDDMAPEGRLLKVTETLPENPARLATKIWTGGLYVPTVIETTAGETVIMKSGWEPVGGLPPPQLTAAARPVKRTASPRSRVLDLTRGVVPLAHLDMAKSNYLRAMSESCGSALLTGGYLQARVRVN